jgi:hypothetical protein
MHQPHLHGVQVDAVDRIEGAGRLAQSDAVTLPSCETSARARDANDRVGQRQARDPRRHLQGVLVTTEIAGIGLHDMGLDLAGVQRDPAPRPGPHLGVRGDRGHGRSAGRKHTVGGEVRAPAFASDVQGLADQQGFGACGVDEKLSLDALAVARSRA